MSAVIFSTVYRKQVIFTKPILDSSTEPFDKLRTSLPEVHFSFITLQKTTRIDGFWFYIFYYLYSCYFSLLLSKNLCNQALNHLINPHQPSHMVKSYRALQNDPFLLLHLSFYIFRFYPFLFYNTQNSSLCSPF